MKVVGPLMHDVQNGPYNLVKQFENYLVAVRATISTMIRSINKYCRSANMDDLQ